MRNRGGAHVFAVVVLAIAVLIGASSQPSAGGPSGTTIQFSWAIEQEPATLDPHVSSGRYDYQVEKQIFDNLIARGPRGNFLPWLASAWSVSSNGLVWTLNLRQGVTFHDGTPFNAEAVKFNFDRIVDPSTKSEKARFAIGPYDRTEIVNDYEVRIHLKQPFGPFLNGLTEPTVSMVSPTAARRSGADFGRNPVGSGPFTFVEWVRTERIVLRKNPAYNWAAGFFSHQGPAFLDNVTLRFISEPGTRMAALESGQVDLIMPVPDADVERASTQFTTLKTAVLGFPPSLMLNTKKRPLDDIRVRKALQYAVDKQAIVNAVFHGTHRVSHGPLSPSNFSYDPAVEKMYKYDPEQAKKLLAEAGWTPGSDGILQKGGARFHLEYVTLPGVKPVAELVQAQLKKVGISASVKAVTVPAIFDDLQKGRHHITWLNWLVDDPSGLRTVFGSENIGSGWNFSHYANRRLDQLFVEGERSIIQGRRREIYRQVQQILMQDAVSVPLYVVQRVWGFKRNVKGVFVGPDGEYLNLYDIRFE